MNLSMQVDRGSATTMTVADSGSLYRKLNLRCTKETAPANKTIGIFSDDLSDVSKMKPSSLDPQKDEVHTFST